MVEDFEVMFAYLNEYEQTIIFLSEQGDKNHLRHLREIRIVKRRVLKWIAALHQVKKSLEAAIRQKRHKKLARWYYKLACLSLRFQPNLNLLIFDFIRVSRDAEKLIDTDKIKEMGLPVISVPLSIQIDLAQFNYANTIERLNRVDLDDRKAAADLFVEFSHTTITI